MVSNSTLERRVVVFSVWMTLGVAGLCLVLQGLTADSFPLGLAGIACLLAGFIGHIIVNAVFGTDFSKGEIAFGTAVSTLTAAMVVMGWAAGGASMADQFIAGTLMMVVLVGVLSYLVHRFGVRRLFSRFHSRHVDGQDTP